MDNSLELLVTDAEAGERLDRFLVRRVDQGGRAQVSRWLDAGQVTVDGARLRKGDRVQVGQRVRVELQPRVDTKATIVATEVSSQPQLCVVYEDAHLIVVDKPAGLPTHGATADEPNTLTAQLLVRYPELRGVGYRDNEPGILHRLDNDTSGLLIAARTVASFERLKNTLKAGAIEKRYVALCAGQVTAPHVFSGFLVSVRRARVKVSPVDVARSRAARTDVIEAQPIAGYSLLTVSAPHAGRHQIRAHLADAGHPLVGDTLYGGPTIAGLDHHFLHASELRFPHPTSGAPLHFTSPLPADLAAIVQQLGR